MKKNKIDDDVIRRAQKADDILQRMEDRFNRIRRVGAKPDTISYASVLNGYANAGKAPEAERILNKMIAVSNHDNATSLSDHKEFDVVKPNVICFNTVIDAWSKTRGSSSAENAHAILQKMEDLSETSNDLFPDTISYTSAISAYARSGRDDAGDRAEELLQRSLELYNDGHHKLKPDRITFTSCIDAMSKQYQKLHRKHRRNEPECHKIEDRINALIQQMDEQGLISTMAYNILLDLFAKTGQVKKAEETFEQMKEEKGNRNVKPDIISYNSLLQALCRQKHNQSSLAKAQSLLQSMEDGDNDVKPDVGSYNTVMTGLAKNNSSSQSNRNTKSNNDLVQRYLSSMEERYQKKLSNVKPNLITYNICIGSWSRSGHEQSVDRAIELLDKMIDSDDNYILQPDVFSFASVISTIAKSGKKNGLEHATSTMDKMKQLGVKANRVIYNSLINCWSKSGRPDAAEKAEEILIMMSEADDPEVSPDSVTFSSVINCWAQRGGPGSGERAEKILDMMEHNWKSGNNYMKPNRYTYGSVLNAWVKSQDDSSVERCMGLLDRMKRSHKEGNDDAQPTAPSYNAVINAFARCSSPTKAVDAEVILDTMIDSYNNGNREAKPNMRTYGTLLNACAYAHGGSNQENAATFKVARRCFKEALNGGKTDKPNSIVFSLFIISCLNLVPPGTKRDQLIVSVFDECCKRGLVDGRIVMDIRKSSPVLRRQLLESSNLMDGYVHINDIPVKWRSNIRQNYNRPTNR